MRTSETSDMDSSAGVREQPIGSDAVPLSSVRHAVRRFRSAQRSVTALNDVSIDVFEGECVALIGGSGSGKSTLGGIMLGLDHVEEGSVEYRSMPVCGIRSAGYRALRKESGLVLQNPFDSLNPRWMVERIVREPLDIQDRSLSRDERASRVCDAIRSVGLDPAEFVDRYPMDLSGGQAQRIAIARAIVNIPTLLVADEPMSAIDVNARVTILDTFASIRRRHPSMAMLFISHDLGVVQHIADRIVVLHDGEVCESGDAQRILNHPGSSYTKALIAAASWQKS
jgi:peptide/nickel transport system ATP-binding protein